MNVDQYQKDAARTLIDEPDTTFTNDELAIMLAALELGAAVGKVLDYVKKGICHRHGFDQKTLKDLIETCEDAGWALKIRHLSKVPPYTLSGNEQMLVWCALGLGGEAGEVMDSISGLPNGAIGGMELVKEQGDVAWYLASIATLMGVSLSDVMQANIQKLKTRFPEGWGSQASIDRVDVERNA